MNLKDKVVLIAGASEGIGAACARAFADRGALLSLTARNADALQQIARPSDIFTPGDLTSAPHRAALVEQTLQRFGRIDVLVNNAAVGVYKPAHERSLAVTRQMFDLNFFAALDMIQLVVPTMKRQHSGTIVNVSSIAGKVVLPWLTAYSASKAALCSLTDGLRIELRRFGIHAMTVCPGYVKTSFQQHVIDGHPPNVIARSRHWAITTDQCAGYLVRGVERGSRTVMAPPSGWLLLGASRLLPSLVERQFEKIYMEDHVRNQEVQAGS